MDKCNWVFWVALTCPGAHQRRIHMDPWPLRFEAKALGEHLYPVTILKPYAFLSVPQRIPLASCGRSSLVIRMKANWMCFQQNSISQRLPYRWTAKPNM